MWTQYHDQVNYSLWLCHPFTPQSACIILGPCHSQFSWCSDFTFGGRNRIQSSLFNLQTFHTHSREHLGWKWCSRTTHLINFLAFCCCRRTSVIYSYIPRTNDLGLYHELGCTTLYYNGCPPNDTIKYLTTDDFDINTCEYELHDKFETTNNID